MNTVYLIEPSKDHEKEFNSMIEEWENTGQRIYPSAIRRKGRDYLTWLEYIQRCSRKETCPSNYIPADTYFLINESRRILGAVNIRQGLNDMLFKTGGHIGYGIRPSERRKGYAKYMLSLALEKCRDMGINNVLVTCNKDNIPSARTIIANGGMLENEVVEDDGNVVQRYWINI